MSNPLKCLFPLYQRSPGAGVLLTINICRAAAAVLSLEWHKEVWSGAGAARGNYSCNW